MSQNQITESDLKKGDTLFEVFDRAIWNEYLEIFVSSSGRGVGDFEDAVEDELPSLSKIVNPGSIVVENNTLKMEKLSIDESELPEFKNRVTTKSHGPKSRSADVSIENIQLEGSIHLYRNNKGFIVPESGDAAVYVDVSVSDVYDDLI